MSFARNLIHRGYIFYVILKYINTNPVHILVFFFLFLFINKVHSVEITHISEIKSSSIKTSLCDFKEILPEFRLKISGKGEL